MMFITSWAMIPYPMVVRWTPSRENSPPALRPSGPEAKNRVVGIGLSAAISDQTIESGGARPL
jgi:hypothetical protein